MAGGIEDAVAQVATREDVGAAGFAVHRLARSRGDPAGAKPARFANGEHLGGRNKLALVDGRDAPKNDRAKAEIVGDIHFLC